MSLLFRLKHLAGYLSPATRRAYREQRASDEAFHARLRAVDEAFDGPLGLDTGGKVHCATGDGTAYQGVFPERLANGICWLNIDLGRFAFIDIGSGKGRACLVAGRYPFACVVGVECSAELHKIATQNRRIIESNSWLCCGLLNFWCVDALEYELPNRPLVIYINNPFGQVTMERFAARVYESLAAHPRECYLLYFTATCADVWERAGPKLIWRHDDWLARAYRLK